MSRVCLISYYFQLQHAQHFEKGKGESKGGGISIQYTASKGLSLLPLDTVEGSTTMLL